MEWLWNILLGLSLGILVHLAQKTTPGSFKLRSSHITMSGHSVCIAPTQRVLTAPKTLSATDGFESYTAFKVTRIGNIGNTLL